MVALRKLTRTADDLDRLAAALVGLSLAPALTPLLAERDRLVRDIRDYLIPRVTDPSTPVTVVFAGPTGSGKSTIINSLTGVDLSAAGPLRPTTTTPVVLTSVDRAGDFDRIAGVDCEVVAGSSSVLDAMAFVDTPDIDSTTTHHREMSETLIDIADVVVFVTSALRYADAVPWQVLRRAQSRGTGIIHVLNRVSSSTRGAVVDFRSRLDGAGLNDDLLTVPEHHLPPDSQQVPSLAVRSLRRALATLAADRTGTAGQAFDRVLRSVLTRVDALDEELTEILDQLESMREEMSIDLAGRVERLDLTIVADGLVPPVAADVSSREVRRWKRSARRGELTKSDGEQIVSRIENVVHQDLRQWLVGLSKDIPSLTVEPGRILPLTLPVLRLAMEGWLDFVRRVAHDDRRRGVGLVEAVLVTAVTDPARESEARIVLKEEADEMTGRARRELAGRLEVVYKQAGSQVGELLESRVGVIDLIPLRAALGALTSRVAVTAPDA